MSVFFINVLSPDDRLSDADYKSTIADQVSASVESGFQYTLITVGHKRRDPWITAQYAMQLNSKFSPLIAINPNYIHPLAAAKKIATLGEFYPNTCAFNLVTGSFSEEMRSVADTCDFAQRNLRLREYYEIIQRLRKSAKVSFEGKFYSLKGAEIFPRASSQKLDFFVSGSLQELWPAEDLESTYFVRNLRPELAQTRASSPTSGLGLGICVRDTQEEAEESIGKLFPQDRGAELLFSMALKNSNTPWNLWLRPYLENHSPDDPDYHLAPMRYGRSSAPYIVGSYERVARRLYSLAELGYRFFLLDFARDDWAHVAKCIERFRKMEGIERG